MSLHTRNDTHTCLISLVAMRMASDTLSNSTSTCDQNKHKREAVSYRVHKPQKHIQSEGGDRRQHTVASS